MDRYIIFEETVDRIKPYPDSKWYGITDLNNNVTSYILIDHSNEQDVNYINYKLEMNRHSKPIIANMYIPGCKPTFKSKYIKPHRGFRINNKLEDLVYINGDLYPAENMEGEYLKW